MNSQLQNQFLTLIGTAITNHRVIQIRYNGIWRTIEPYMVGLNPETQTTSFYGFCRDVIPALDAGKDSRWQLFPFNDIEEIELTYYEFRPHVEYTGRYDRIFPVYVKLTPSVTAIK